MGLKGISTKTSPIDPAQVKLLLEVPGRDGLFFNIALYTGLRLSEITALKWSDLLDGQGAVKNVVTVRITKQSFFRKIALKEDLKNRIMAQYHQDGRPDISRHVFCAKRGGRTVDKPLSEKGVNKFIVRKHFELLGIKCSNNSSHALRKSMAKAYYDKYGLAETQALLGHKSGATTLCYIGITDETIANNLKELSYD